MRYMTTVLVKIHFLTDCSSCQPVVQCWVMALLAQSLSTTVFQTKTMTCLHLKIFSRQRPIPYLDHLLGWVSQHFMSLNSCHLLCSNICKNLKGREAQWACTQHLLAPKAPALKSLLALPALYTVLPAQLTDNITNQFPEILICLKSRTLLQLKY